MGQGAQDLRTLDYYLTTVLKDTKKTGSHCAATASRFAPFYLNICTKLLEPLGHLNCTLQNLITPTLKAAGSNPVGRTKRNPRALTALGFLFFPAAFSSELYRAMYSAKAQSRKIQIVTPDHQAYNH